MPKNHKRWRYIVNDGAPHVETNQTLQKFLIELVPSKSRRIVDFMSEFQMFILDVESEEITRLYIDQKEVERQVKTKVIQSMRNYSSQKREKEAKESRRRPFDKQNDNVLKRFS